MKSIVKMFKAVVLTALILFSMAACGDPSDNNGDNDGPTHYGGSFQISNQQVWEGTNSNKISELYKKFEGDREIKIYQYEPTGDGKHGPVKIIGPGEIDEGFLNCDVPEPDDLMVWDDFKFVFSSWDDLACNQDTTKGTYLRLVTSEDEWLNLEKMSGSNDSVWLESIWFIYIDKDCQITGTPSEGIRPGDAFYETDENLDLALKKGWNTICRKQFLRGDRGIETDSIKIKNPKDFKWTIRSNHP